MGMLLQSFSKYACRSQVKNACTYLLNSIQGSGFGRAIEPTLCVLDRATNTSTWCRFRQVTREGTISRRYGTTSSTVSSVFLSREQLTVIQQEFLEALDDLKEEFVQIAKMPNSPVEVLQQKWTFAHLATIPGRLQILGKHGFDPSPDGHLDFTMAAHKVLRSLGPKTALTLPNPFQKMAVQVFDLENPEPFSPSEMDEMMDYVLEELESESCWMDVEDLAAHARTSGDSKGAIQSQLGILKTEATLRAIARTEHEETECWVRVMMSSHMWAATADPKVTARFLAIDNKMKSCLGLL